MLSPILPCSVPERSSGTGTVAHVKVASLGQGVKLAGTVSVKEPSAVVTDAARSAPTWLPEPSISMSFADARATPGLPASARNDSLAG